MSRHNRWAAALRMLAGMGALCGTAAVSCSSTGDCLPRLVQVVFRHGDRSPVRTIPSLDKLNQDGVDPWPAGLGQLTSRGEAQHFHLGKLLRDRYVLDPDYALVPTEYNRKQVFINSTDVDRTLMSVASQLAAWFPTNASQSPYSINSSEKILWRPIPVHTVPKQQDYYIAEHQADGVCPELETRYNTHPSRPEWRAKLEQPAGGDVCTILLLDGTCTNENAIKAVETRLNMSGLTLENIWRVSDTLFVRSQHDLPVPSWATMNSNAVLNWVIDLAAWQMYEMYSGDTERRLSGGNLVKLMLSNIEAKFSNGRIVENDSIEASLRRLVLYSAHDTTLAALLMALDENHFGLISAPPYASAVIMELYTDATGSRDSAEIRLLYERIYHNQKDNTDVPWEATPLAVHGCTHTCPLNNFSNLMQPVIPADYFDECGLSKTLLQKVVEQVNAYRVAFGLLLSVVVLVCAGLVVRGFKKRRQLQNFAALSPGTRYRISDDNDEDEPL